MLGEVGKWEVEDLGSLPLGWDSVSLTHHRLPLALSTTRADAQTMQSDHKGENTVNMAHIGHIEEVIRGDYWLYFAESQL